MPIIKEVSGNLITMAEEGQFTHIAHGCNCFHAMGSGIAGQLARKYPKVPETDILQTVFGDPLKLGTFTVTEILDPRFFVINMYTQYDVGSDSRKAEYSAIASCFRLADEVYKFRQHCYSEKFSFGIPLIGAGLAGGDWDLIERIINKVTPNIEITVVHFEG